LSTANLRSVGDHGPRSSASPPRHRAVREPELAEAACRMVDVRPAGRDQPRRDQHAEPRRVAEAIGLATREGRRGLGRQHRGRDRLRRGPADRRPEAFIDDTNYSIFGAAEKAHRSEPLGPRTLVSTRPRLTFLPCSSESLEASRSRSPNTVVRSRGSFQSSTSAPIADARRSNGSSGSAKAKLWTFRSNSSLAKAGGDGSCARRLRRALLVLQERGDCHCR
jgi:hypothetical protein